MSQVRMDKIESYLDQLQDSQGSLEKAEKFLLETHKENLPALLFQSVLDLLSLSAHLEKHI